MLKRTFTPRQSIPQLRKQTGAVLVICLVMLLAATLFAVSGINSSLMQEKMAANAQNYTRVFQAAESAVSALVTQLDNGDITALSQALARTTDTAAGTSDLTSLDDLDKADPDIDSTYQAVYLGEVIITSGNSMDADENSVDLKSYRFEIQGVANMAAVNAGTQINQGVEYTP